MISDNDWTVTPVISGRNGDNTQSWDEVAAEITDANAANSRFTGVVSIEIKQNGVRYGCSGTAISSHHILSAGHCVDSTGNGTVLDLSDPNNAIDVVFNHDGDASATISANNVDIHPDYHGFSVCSDGSSGCVNDDIAVITLESSIPDGVDIYEFYPDQVQDTYSSGSDGDTLTLVGYGEVGDGYSGYYESYPNSDGTYGFSLTDKKVGGNIVDMLEEDDEESGTDEVWYADFDGVDIDFGVIDYFGDNGIFSSFLDNETIIGGGDSGGASFIYDPLLDQYFLAAISTFTVWQDGWTEGAFGDLLGGVLLNPYLDWIDSVIASNEVPEPTSVLLFLSGLTGAGLLRRRFNK